VRDWTPRNIVDDLWNGTRNPNHVGDGTTMDAVRNELRTSRKVPCLRSFDARRSGEEEERRNGKAAASAPIGGAEAQPRRGPTDLEMRTSRKQKDGVTLMDYEGGGFG